MIGKRQVAEKKNQILGEWGEQQRADGREFIQHVRSNFKKRRKGRLKLERHDKMPEGKADLYFFREKENC